MSSTTIATPSPHSSRNNKSDLIIQHASKASNIFEFISHLSNDVLNKLYANVWACKAVFRNLNELAKQYTLRLTFSEGQVSIQKLITGLVQEKTENTQQPTAIASHHHQQAITQLTNLKVILIIEKGNLKMHPVFQNTFRTILINPVILMQRETSKMETDPDQAQGADMSSTSSSMEKDKKAPSRETLENHAKERWETVLEYIASLSNKVTKGIKSLLERSNLVQSDMEGSENLAITNEGFQFLLQDAKTQIWILLRKYIETAPERKQDIVEVMQFLFELSFLEPGKDYPVSTLTATQQVLLLDLAEFGLIYLRKSRSKVFYPTPLAAGIIIAENVSLDWINRDQGYIIVETTYRLYAYTNSPLHIALLSLFVDLEYRLPNLVVGTIRRDSVRAALASGITANQILAYLHVHSHPEMKKRSPILPATVVDQIRLWEHERSRIQATDAVMYDKFSNLQMFKRVEEYSKKIGVYLWSSHSKMILVVKPEGHENVKHFLQML